MSLLKEARNAIRLRHPAIVSIFDVGRIHNEYYIAMEFLEGVTLQQRNGEARRNGKPSHFFENPRLTLKLVAEVARAVHYAHTRPSPIIHCDLKPANILIDPAGGPHVFDFGLARNLRVERPGEDGEISGTPCYMAPEQASGRSADIDARTDIWALGAILYELLTGQPTFAGEPFEVIHRTIMEAPRPLRQALDESTRNLRKDEVSTRVLLQIPPFLEELCMRCLAREKADRPGSMAEVADVLESGMKTPEAGVLR